MKQQRTWRALSLVAVAALTVTACGGGADEAAGDGTPPVSIGSATDGGQNYDPMSAGNQYVTQFLLPVYDSLLSIGSDGEIAPMLAESFELSEDSTEISLKLREDVTFHDGSDFDAEVVKANLERSKDGEGSVLSGQLASIEEIEIVSPYELKLHLTEPDAGLLPNLADRAGMMISGEALENENLDVQPVGAGPYEVTNHLPGDRIEYTKFEDYWDFNDETVTGINIDVIIDAETRLRSATSGDLDAVGIGMDQVQQAADGGLEVETYDAKTVPWVIYLNMQEGSPLEDPNVRKAISLAIDRDGINEGILNGACTPSLQLFRDDYWAASEDLPSGSDSQDIDAAIELLEEAGYGDGFEMSLAAISSAPYRMVAEALGSQLEEVGIDVELKIGEPVQVVGDFNEQRVTDAYTSLWPGAADPSRTFSTLYDETGLFNPGNYVDEELDELMQAGTSTLDQDERAEIYQDLSNRAHEQMVHVPICNADFPIAAREGVSGFELTPAGTQDFRFLINESE